MSHHDKDSTETLLAQLTRPLPYSLEAEQGVLSCLLQDPGNRMGECLTGLHPSAFYHDGCRHIYHAMLELYVDEQPLDVVSISHHLRRTEKLDKAGGPGALSELFTFVPVDAHWAHYLGIVKEDWQNRRHIDTLVRRILAVFEDGRDGKPLGSAKLIVESEGALSNLAPPSSRNGLQHVGKIVPGALKEMQDAIASRGHVTRGIGTGFTDLDRATMGIETGLFIVAARPSKGKTVFMLQWALNVALAAGHYDEFDQAQKAVGIWSLETETTRLVRRMLCNRASINLGRARDGMISRAQQESLQTEALRLKDSPIYLEACFGLSIQELRVKVRQAVKRYDLKMVMVDYLQLLTSHSRAAEMSRTTAIAEVSQGLKAMAHELDVPVIALAQINRDGDKPRPGMGDIKDCGQIEQDADYIAILCDGDAGDDEPHARKTKDEDGEETVIDLTGDVLIGLDLVKLKEGRTTTDGPPIKLKFEREYFRMMSTTGRLFSNNDERRQH